MPRQVCQAVRQLQLIERYDALLRGGLMSLPDGFPGDHFTDEEWKLLGAALMNVAHRVDPNGPAWKLAEQTAHFQVYRIEGDGIVVEHNAIRCRHCGHISHSPEDASRRYCGNCRIHHDDRDPRAALAALAAQDEEIAKLEAASWATNPEPNAQEAAEAPPELPSPKDNASEQALYAGDHVYLGTFKPAPPAPGSIDALLARCEQTINLSPFAKDVLALARGQIA